MNFEAASALLEKYSQQHVLHYYDKLSDTQKATLLSSIENIDFSAFKTLNTSENKQLGQVTPIDALSLKEIKKQRSRYIQTGLAAIREGRVGVVLLAGGQGTRLGFNGPKGTFDIGVNKPLYIFECQINSIKASCAPAQTLPHLFIMTGPQNDEITRKFMEEHDYFGYDKKLIHFFVQGVAPAISYDGKILMAEKYKPVLTPDGNGGWFAALNKAYGRMLSKWGIEWLNLVGVDNVLQKICDPAFIGATIGSGVNCGCKSVKKVSPDERVGVICKEDGVPTVIEYYDMPQKLKVRHDVKGELIYCYGVILNYLFSVEKLKETIKKKLPYHLAEKKIPCIKGGKKFVPEAPNGYKLEQLAVDLVKLMGSCIAYEVEREVEFAPVKNATGIDSVESARALLIKNGVEL
ncbi:MAG: UTP--glucose-1-phosphate uridylyltransferase [Candidatus Coproplasma sp.]